MATKRTVYKFDWAQIRLLSSWFLLLVCVVVGSVLIKSMYDEYKVVCAIEHTLDSGYVEKYSAADVVIPMNALLLSQVVLVVSLIIVRQFQKNYTLYIHFPLTFFLGIGPLIGCTCAAFGIFDVGDQYKKCVLSRSDVQIWIAVTYVFYAVAILGAIICCFHNICSGIAGLVMLVVAALTKFGKWLKRVFTIVHIEQEPV